MRTRARFVSGCVGMREEPVSECATCMRGSPRTPNTSWHRKVFRMTSADAIARMTASETAHESFVRTCAYATGAPYGMLLDALSPGWHRKLTATSDLGWVLSAAAGVTALPDAAATARVMTARRYERTKSGVSARSRHHRRATPSFRRRRGPDGAARWQRQHQQPGQHRHSRRGHRVSGDGESIRGGPCSRAHDRDRSASCSNDRIPSNLFTNDWSRRRHPLLIRVPSVVALARATCGLWLDR